MSNVEERPSEALRFGICASSFLRHSTFVLRDLSTLPHERIRSPFFADGRRRTVSGQHRDIVAEREELLFNPTKEEFSVPAR